MKLCFGILLEDIYLGHSCQSGWRGGSPWVRPLAVHGEADVRTDAMGRWAAKAIATATCWAEPAT